MDEIASGLTIASEDDPTTDTVIASTSNTSDMKSNSGICINLIYLFFTVLYYRY